MQVNLIVVAYKCVHQNKIALGQVVTKIAGQVDTVQQLAQAANGSEFCTYYTETTYCMHYYVLFCVHSRLRMMTSAL